MCGHAKAGLRPMPLTDGFEVIRAEVGNYRIFAIFGTLNPLNYKRNKVRNCPKITFTIILLIQIFGAVV